MIKDKKREGIIDSTHKQDVPKNPTQDGYITEYVAYDIHQIQRKCRRKLLIDKEYKKSMNKEYWDLPIEMKNKNKEMAKKIINMIQGYYRIMSK